MSAKVRMLLGSPQIVREALLASLTKLDPRLQLRNPVMFVVFVGSILTTILFFASLGSTSSTSGESSWFVGGISLWLWGTVLFANFAEAVAEGHGKAQADTLRKSRQQVPAHKIFDRSKNVYGSELLGQSFDDPRYFWGRLTATGPFPYNAAASGGSNLGPLNPAVKAAADARAEALRKHDPDLKDIPVDLLTASGSGLDPHIGSCRIAICNCASLTSTLHSPANRG